MVEINNLTKEKIDSSFLKKIAELVLKGENRYNKELSIALVSAEEIKRLNKKFRGKDNATDVLAFDENSKSEILNPKANYLGEVIICPFEVRANAKEDKIEFEKELAKVLIHGILHLLGYDHEKTAAEAIKMREKENFYLEQLE